MEGRPSAARVSDTAGRARLKKADSWSTATRSRITAVGCGSTSISCVSVMSREWRGSSRHRVEGPPVWTVWPTKLGRGGVRLVPDRTIRVAAGREVVAVRWWRVLGVVAVVLAASLVSGCAAGVNTSVGAGEAGFWMGLWHGLISPVTFVVSLFTDAVSIYEVRNSGGWYDLGFVAGVAVALGSGGHGAGSARRSARRSRSSR